MKIKYGLYISFLFFLFGCSNPVDNNDARLQISFKNNSSSELSNLIVANNVIGRLESGRTTKYFQYDKFNFDTGLPDEDASALIDGKLYTNYSRGYWCGTEKLQVDSGKYLVEIEVIETMLFLSCKNAPRRY